MITSEAQSNDIDDIPITGQRGVVTPVVEPPVEPPVSERRNYAPYSNEQRDPADAPPPDIFPESDADNEIDQERYPLNEAGMREGGLTGSIEEDR
jgi:hypothetical protein